MATQWQTFPIEFRGGLISNLSPLQHGTNAVGSATILQNFEPNKAGGYSKVLGYQKWDSAIVPGTGPVLGVKVVDSGKVIAVRSNGTVSVIYSSTGSGWTQELVRPFNGSRVRSTDVNIASIHKIIFVDGVNYPAVYDADTGTVSAITSSTDILAADHVALFKTTVFYAKDNFLYFTAPSSFDDFSPANGAGVIDIGHEITGLAVFRDQLIIFSRNSIRSLTGSTTADFNLSPITDRIGCINPDTIQEIGGDIMYVAPDGVRLLSATDRIGDFGLDVASDPITKDATNFIVQGAPEFMSVVVREKAQYRLFAYVASEPESSAKGLLTTKFISQGGSGLAWATLKGFKVYCADSKYTESYAETIVFGNDTGYVYRMENGSSLNGEIIEAIYESPYMPISDPQTRKTFYKITLYADPTGPMSLDLNLKFDFGSATNTGVVQPNTIQIASTGTSVFFFGDSQAIFGSSTFGGELDKVYNKNIIGSGKTVAIRIEDNSTNPTFTLDTAILEFQQNDRQ